MWSFFSEAFTEALFNYLNTRSLTRKLIDFFLIATLATWIALVYTVATNYNSLLASLNAVRKVDVVAAIRLDHNINEELDHLIHETESDRTALARFHDSVKDLQGHHFIYETRSNESLQPGVAPAVPVRQSVLISVLGPWATELLKDKCIYTTDLKPLDALYEFYRQIGVRSDIKCPVFSIKGELVGFVYSEFTTRTLTVDELKHLEGKIRNSSVKIGAILSVGVDD